MIINNRCEKIPFWGKQEMKETKQVGYFISYQ